MIKSKYTGITLNCMMQTEEITTTICPTGMLSKDTDGNFLFQEEVRKGRAPRNPKLYDGKFVTLVRMKNGRYQMHLKTMSDDFDRDNYAFGVYSDVSSALERMQ